MNTNNKEALERLEHVLKYSSLSANAIYEIETVIELLLQDNEDTEVEEEYSCIGNHCAFYRKPHTNCHIKVNPPKPSSKVEKLEKLKYRSGIWNSKDPVYLDEFKQLIDILIEDEE